MADINGFDLQQNNAASNDIRNIMSEQLNELRIMRAEAQKQSTMGEKQVMQSNPFIMNPLYTEHHSKNIDSAMSIMGSQEAVRNQAANAPLKNLARYANEDGYFSMRFGDDIIDGRGYSAKDREVAAAKTQSRIVGGALDKMSGVLGFGSNIAGGAAGTGLASIMGMGALSIPGIGIGIGAGAISEKFVKEGIEEVKTYYDYKERFTEGSDRFIAPGEGSKPYGGGFTKQEIKQASKFMTGLNSQFNLKDSEMSEFYSAASDNNLLKGSQDLESFEKMMTKLTDMSKKYAKVLGKSMTEVANMMGDLKRAGISTDGYAAVFNTLDSNSALLGMSAEQYASYVADRTGNTTYGTSANANKTALSIVKEDALVGGILNTMSNVRSEDPSFDLANYISNLGAEGLAGSLSSIENQTAPVVDNTVLMAAYDTKTGNVDPKKVKEILDKMKKGDLSVQDVSKMAGATTSQKDFNFFAYEGETREFKAENGLLTIEAGVATTLSGMGMTMDEFLKIKNSDKQASILMSAGFSETDANVAVGAVTTTNGNIAMTGEGAYNSSRMTNRLDALSEDWSDRFDLFGPQKELKQLYNVDVDSYVDYSKKMTYNETRKAMKFGYASLTSNLGESDKDVSARRLVENAINSQIADTGWADDGTAFIDGIAGQISGRSKAGNTLNDAITISAKELGLTDVVKVLEGVKSNSGEFSTKEVKESLTKIMQADSDGFLSEEANAGNNAMMAAIDKNTEAQIEVIRKITKKFEDTTTEIVDMMDKYSNFNMGGR